MSKAVPWSPGSRLGKEVLLGSSSRSRSFPCKLNSHEAEERRKKTISLPPKVFRVDQDLCSLTSDQLRKRLLIGRFRSFFPGLKEISDWFEKICTQKGWKATVLRMIGKGFFLVLAEEENVRTELLTGVPFSLKSMKCIFQPWRPNFDPLVEQALVPTWITLPFFPEELRNQLPMIASLFGKSIYVPSVLDGMHVRFCVQLDTSKGVSPVLELLCPEGTYSQEVEYDGIPLRCFLCRSTDHLVGKCPRGKARGIAKKMTGETIIHANRVPSLSPEASPAASKEIENEGRHSSVQEDESKDQAEAIRLAESHSDGQQKILTISRRRSTTIPHPKQRVTGEVQVDSVAVPEASSDAPLNAHETAIGSSEKSEGTPEFQMIQGAVTEATTEAQVKLTEEAASDKWEKVTKRYTRREKMKAVVADQATATSLATKGQTRFSKRLSSKQDILAKELLEEDPIFLERSSEDDSLHHSVIPSRLSIEPEI